MNRRLLFAVLILKCLVGLTHADISKQELQKWIDDSTLVFKGTIVALDSNVDSITASDYPITVKASQVELDAGYIHLCDAKEVARLEEHR
jgi:hypothetical protein